jgi:hypothetical protein
MLTDKQKALILKVSAKEAARKAGKDKAVWKVSTVEAVEITRVRKRARRNLTDFHWLAQNLSPNQFKLTFARDFMYMGLIEDFINACYKNLNDDEVKALYQRLDDIRRKGEREMTLRDIARHKRGKARDTPKRPLDLI